MAASIYDLTSKLNPHLLAERMYRQQFGQGKFAQFIASEFIKRGGKADNVTSVGDVPQFTGAPIEVFQDFVTKGRTDMDIPVKNRLTGMPVYGDQPLKGTAEAQVVTFRTVPINLTRKATAPPTGMSEQIAKQYLEALMTSADADLNQWFQDYHPGNFMLSFLAGASHDLVCPAKIGGRAVSIVSHPNLVVAGSGFVTTSNGLPGTAAYEASVEAAINGLADDAKSAFSVALIRNVAIEAPRKKIARIVMQNGYEFYPIFCSDAQWAQLQQDAEFKDWMKRIPEGLKGHPLATGAEAFIAGCAIYPDMMSWGARTNAIDSNVTAGTVEYGPAPSASERGLGYKVGNWIGNLDTSNVKMAMLVGKSALSVGVGKKIKFTEQVDDHGHVREVGIEFIQSVVRNDIYDLDGKVAGLTAGDFYENPGSLAIATYSKHALQYA